MSAQPTRRYRWRRLRRAVAAVVYGGLIVWIAYIAVTRWNGVPADTSLASFNDLPPRTPPDPKLDRTAAIIAAIAAIPPEPTWTLPPPPEGMRWERSPAGPIDLSEAVDGPWTPGTRPHLKAVIDYLETPAVQDAITQLATIEPGVCHLTSGAPKSMRRAYGLLAAQARYNLAERGDSDAAIDDLLTMLRLSATFYTSLGSLVNMTAQAIERGTEEEIMRLAFERHLNCAQAERILTAMQSILPGPRTLWQYVVDTEVNKLTRTLDLSYTIDADGDGWLVLSRLSNMYMNPQLVLEPRFGLWNAASPLFNNRRTVAAKIKRIGESLAAVDQMSFAQAWDKLGQMQEHYLFSLMDGPLTNASATQFARSRWRGLVGRTASYRATLVAIALSTYRGEHDEYPSSLEALVGPYLDAVPVDPFDGHPLRYIPVTTQDDFVLYAIGADQVDDGGLPQRGLIDSTDAPKGDQVFFHTRERYLNAEIKLEKVKP